TPPPPPPVRPAGRARGATGLAGGGHGAARADAATPPRPHVVPGAPTAPGGASRASITDVVPKRTLVIVVAVVLLAVLGTVLAFAVNRGGDKDDAGTSGTRPTASSTPQEAAEADTDPTGDGGANTPTTDGSSPAGQDGGKNPKPGGLPAGYQRVSDGRFHFAMALPEGWRGRPIPGYSGGAVYSADGGFPRVQVDFNAKPLPDAAQAWRGAEPGASRSMKGYRGLGIHTVPWRGYPTVADWSFEREQRGQTVRVLNRGFKVDAHRGYAVMVTCAKDAWAEKECTTLRQTALRTFTPRG
ncbi:serine/threonine protein kinase, partial [Streptomyces sp. NPDC057676]